MQAVLDTGQAPIHGTHGRWQDGKSRISTQALLIVEGISNNLDEFIGDHQAASAWVSGACSEEASIHIMFSVGEVDVIWGGGYNGSGNAEGTGQWVVSKPAHGTQIGPCIFSSLDDIRLD